MPKPLLFVDFDRTLFDTGRFFDDLWNALAEFYGIDSERERSRVHNFHNSHGDNWYDYDFFRHLDTLLPPSESEQQAIAKLRGILIGNYFLMMYPAC